MTNWKMYGQIQEHKRKGFNKSQIARLLGKDYKTILKYWDMTPDEFAAEKEYTGTRIKKAEPYEEYVVECLRKYPAAIMKEVRWKKPLPRLSIWKEKLTGR
jgi:hypothetical protein